MNQSRQIISALNESAPPEPVIVRRWKDGQRELIVIFPEWSTGPGHVQMWGNDGGGSGDMKRVMKQTTDVNPNDPDVKQFLVNVKRSALPDGVNDFKLVRK